MTQKQILEGNKLIAEFMGCKKEKNNPDLYHTGHFYNTEIETGIGMQPSNEDVYGYDEMKYNSSWDWLMPVVEKIESLGFWINIKKNHVTVAYDNKNTYDSNMIHSEFGDISKIERVYICVINFIKFYNELETGK